MRTGMKM